MTRRKSENIKLTMLVSESRDHIMAEFVLPITLFAGILIIGALLGSIVYFATYFQNSHYDKSSSSSKMFDSMR
jgi:hypothetical protein